MAGKILRSNDDVLPVPATVRDAQHNECGAVRADLGFQFLGFQCVKIDFLAFRQLAKTLFVQVFSYWWPPQERRDVAESRGMSLVCGSSTRRDCMTLPRQRQPTQGQPSAGRNLG